MAGNSLIFTAASSQNLTATGKTSINQQKFTIAFYFKRTTIGAVQEVYNASNGTALHTTQVAFNSGNNFGIVATGSASGMNVQTSGGQTDTTAWHHACIAVDTTQPTAANRVIVYIDGTVPALAASYPALNELIDNNFAHLYSLGSEVSSGFTNYLNAKLAQFYYIDGQQLTPSSFISGTPGTPIIYSGSYTGVFDFFLPFSNGASTTTLGADSSGEGNNWTLNNMTTANQSTDFPGINIGFTNFLGAGLVNANAQLINFSNEFFTGAGLLNASGFIGIVSGNAFLVGAGLLLNSASSLIPSLTPGQTVYIPPEAVFVNNNTAPVFVGQSLALIFGNINTPTPPNEGGLQLVVTKPDGSQRSIGFPLCFVGLVDMPFNTTSNFLYFPSLAAGTYCVGQLYGSEVDQSGNWIFQLFNGANKLSQPVTVFVNPR